MKQPNQGRREIVIGGAGFGGVKAAIELAKDDRNHITLVSENDYFQYYPALYSAATGHSHRQAWVGLDTIFGKRRNVSLVRDTLTKIDPTSKTIHGSGSYRYDELILALGSVTTYFGIDGLDTFAYGIKTQGQIRKLQTHLLDEMSDGKDTERNYVIIGGGPTGVELAGALGEYIRVLRQSFGIRKKGLRVVLIEAAPRLLPRLSERTAVAAMNRLRELGVIVETGKKVERQTADSLVVNGAPLATQTVIWTSGVTNAPFYKANADILPLDNRGKVTVDEYMRAMDNIYVIGDNAATPYSGLAQTALHDALFVARHLKGSSDVYSAKLPPCVVPIGHRWALFEWGKVRFSGLPASLVREAADIIGYTDVLPFGHAVRAWRAQSKKQLTLPETLERTK